MSDHSGSKQHTIPIVSWSESKFDVAVTWNPEDLDRLSDVIREIEDRGEDPWEYIEAAMAREIMLQKAAAVRIAIGEVRESKKPALAADEIAWGIGIALFDGLSCGALSKRHGIKKQAFQQGAETRTARIFGGRTPSSRSLDARLKMKLRNSRQNKYELPGFEKSE